MLLRFLAGLRLLLAALFVFIFPFAAVVGMEAWGARGSSSVWARWGA